MTSATAGADLRIVDVTKRFGDFMAVDDLTLTIPAGSFFAYFLLDLASRVDTRLEVDVHEPRVFEAPAPRICAAADCTARTILS